MDAQLVTILACQQRRMEEAENEEWEFFLSLNTKLIEAIEGARHCRRCRHLIHEQGLGGPCGTNVVTHHRQVIRPQGLLPTSGNHQKRQQRQCKYVLFREWLDFLVDHMDLLHKWDDYRDQLQVVLQRIHQRDFLVPALDWHYWQIFHQHLLTPTPSPKKPLKPESECTTQHESESETDHDEVQVESDDAEQEENSTIEAAQGDANLESPDAANATNTSSLYELATTVEEQLDIILAEIEAGELFHSEKDDDDDDDDDDDHIMTVWNVQQGRAKIAERNVHREQFMTNFVYFYFMEYDLSTELSSEGSTKDNRRSQPVYWSSDLTQDLFIDLPGFFALCTMLEENYPEQTVRRFGQDSVPLNFVCSATNVDNLYESFFQSNDGGMVPP